MRRTRSRGMHLIERGVVRRERVRWQAAGHSRAPCGPVDRQQAIVRRSERRGAMQVWPLFKRVPKLSARTTRSRSASANTRTASSPESSMTEGVLVPARSFRTSRPFSDAPVKMTLSTPPAMASCAALHAFGQNGEERGIEPGFLRESCEKRARHSASPARA